MIGQTDARSLRHTRALYVKICTQPEVILFLEKFDKIFQDPIMAEQLPCFQPGFDFLNVEISDHIYFIKEIKNLFLVHCWVIWARGNFLEHSKSAEKHSPSARASPHFSRVLKNSRVLI